MFYGAGPKGFIWKVGCFVGGLAVVALISAFVMIPQQNSSPQGGFIAFLMLAIAGFVLTLPFGIRGTTLTAGTGGGGFVGVLTSNWMLLFTIGVVYFAVKLVIFVGDLLYSTVWKGIDRLRGRKYAYEDDEVYV